MNDAKLRLCFQQTLGIPGETITDDLAYNSIKEWDSIGHMALVASIETAFGLMLDTNDILDMSSVRKAREILSRHGVSFGDP
jgi:acyl carrier protein